MADMTRALLTTLDALLDRALDLPPLERAAWLTRLRAERPDIAVELEALLAQESELDARRFLEGGLGNDALSVASSLAGLRVGAYTLEHPLGHGGMGNVWLARRSDGRYEGVAAVKLLNLALLDPIGGQRFHREGTALARLTHPNIARLIDAGVTGGGQPYLVLEHIDGRRIDLYCDEHRLSPEVRLRLFLDVLAAVGHAHANLIVHRDLKPSNILVTDDGTIKLLDFGIAKLLEADAAPAEHTALTEVGGLALTPEYAAPEQARGGPITTATDVYALGVLLYVLLTGRHPTGEGCRTAAEHLSGVLDTEPPRLSAAVARRRPSGPDDLARTAEARAATVERLARLYLGDLDNIVAKALKKNPVERYATVAALADDIRRYLAHQPVSARPDSARYRVAKFVRRNRTAVTLAALAGIAMVGGLAGTITQAERATRQAALAEQQRDRADREAHIASSQLDFALRQLSRAEAINELNSFLLTDAAPSGKPFTVGDLLERAQATIERAHSDSDANRVEMLVEIGRQHFFQDEDAKARAVLGQAYDLSRALTDRPTRAKASCAFAIVLSRLGELERAERLIAEGLAELPNDAPFAINRIDCLLRGGEVARNADNGKLGVERVEAAAALLHHLRFPSAGLETQVVMDLAESYRGAERYREAVHVFEQAYAKLVALGRENTQSAGTLLNNWALALSQLGMPVAAAPLFQKAIAVSSADGGEKAVSPMLLNNYARTLNELFRFKEGARYAERAYTTARAAGDEIVINQALLVRAVAYRELGQLNRSASMVDEAESRFKRMFRPVHAAFVAVGYQRALLAEARGNLGEAVRQTERAIATANAGSGSVNNLRVLVRKRADLERKLHRLDAAKRDAEQALAYAKQEGTPDAPSGNRGLAYLVLGRVLLARGEAEAAHAAFASSLENLRPAFGAGHPQTRMVERLAAGGLASADQ